MADEFGRSAGEPVWVRWKGKDGYLRLAHLIGDDDGATLCGKAIGAFQETGEVLTPLRCKRCVAAREKRDAARIKAKLKAEDR